MGDGEEGMIFVDWAKICNNAERSTHESDDNWWYG